MKPRLLRSGRQIEAAVHRSVASPPSGKVLEFFPFVVIRHFAVSVASESSGLRRAQFSRNGYRLKRFRSDNLKFFGISVNFLTLVGGPVGLCFQNSGWL